MVFQVTELKSRTLNLARNPTPVFHIVMTMKSWLAALTLAWACQPVNMHLCHDFQQQLKLPFCFIYQFYQLASVGFWQHSLLTPWRKGSIWTKKYSPSSSVNAVGRVNQYHGMVIGEASSLQHKGHSYTDVFPESLGRLSDLLTITSTLYWKHYSL